eukprot:TRINITY_DN2887_c0_g1_i2.p1 TRINITY_DN2887_c0_g1~~TRINITY_DN2887_c0_g1_i2.p1  ORF type:complete len:283 (+),score=51.20 TRINITY_DN2887_c0_g1_i2:118-849(+)
MAEDGPVQLKIVYAKVTHALEKPSSTTIKDLKTEIEQLTGCASETMKLMHKGPLSAPNKPELDDRTLAEANITKKAKILVVGASKDDLKSVAKVDTLAKSGAFKAEAAATASASASKTNWNEETKHRKVLDKGKPDDAPFAYRPGSDPMPAAPITGMVNHLQQKVRLHFKMEENLVVISTKERTNKVSLSKIQSIKSQAINGHEEYHILGIQLGPTAASMYFIYWFPAQYVSAAKGSVFGGWS